MIKYLKKPMPITAEQEKVVKRVAHKPITEQEYLQTCTTEELAEEIYKCVMAHPWHISKEVILDWLREKRT